MTDETLAGRAFGEIYRVQGRADLHEFLIASVEASGGRVLYASDPQRAPVYLGVQLDSDERIGMLVYPFRITRNAIRNRPADEVRGQLRYGSEESWTREHPVGRDIAGVDVAMILGMDLTDGVLLGLDANLWDPLPMGISFYAKDDEIERARSTGWHVWEKVNRPGTRRSEPRSPTNLETVVAFTPDRLIDYARLERRATSLRLDPPLRYSAAVAMSSPKIGDTVPHRTFWRSSSPSPASRSSTSSGAGTGSPWPSGEASRSTTSSTSLRRPTVWLRLSGSTSTRCTTST